MRQLEWDMVWKTCLIPADQYRNRQTIKSISTVIVICVRRLSMSVETVTRVQYGNEWVSSWWPWQHSRLSRGLSLISLTQQFLLSYCLFISSTLCVLNCFARLFGCKSGDISNESVYMCWEGAMLTVVIWLARDDMIDTDQGTNCHRGHTGTRELSDEWDMKQRHMRWLDDL